MQARRPELVAAIDGVDHRPADPGLSLCVSDVVKPVGRTAGMAHSCPDSRSVVSAINCYPGPLGEGSGFGKPIKNFLESRITVPEKQPIGSRRGTTKILAATEGDVVGEPNPDAVDPNVRALVLHWVDTGRTEIARDRAADVCQQRSITHIHWRPGVEGVVKRRLLHERQNERRHHPAVIVTVARGEMLVDVVIVVQAEANLFEVVDALSAAGGSPCLLHCRQQEAHKNTNNGNHHEQFNERETATKFRCSDKPLRVLDQQPTTDKALVRHDGNPHRIENLRLWDYPIPYVIVKLIQPSLQFLSSAGRFDKEAPRIISMVRATILLTALALLVPPMSVAAPIERVWLSHASHDPSRLVINWETSSRVAGIVEFGADAALGHSVAVTKNAARHHVEIPFGGRDGHLHYRIRSGSHATEIFRCKTQPSRELRLAVVGNWGFALDRDLSSLRHDDPHLLVSAGDNVQDLHSPGREGVRAFAALIDAHHTLFQSIPFLPVLGNHDRELTPRGAAPPLHSVYDVEATAFREFFELPGNEWSWHFDMPAFDLRLIAADLNHIKDHGTTWQTCHAWQPGSPQLDWYAKTMEHTQAGFILTIMNEKQTKLQQLANASWHHQFRKGSGLITGFGYFAERARLDGNLPYFNTSLKGTGDLYKDPSSQFHAREDNYLLVTARAGVPVLTVEIKNLQGKVLDCSEISRRH